MSDKRFLDKTIGNWDGNRWTRITYPQLFKLNADQYKLGKSLIESGSSTVEIFEKMAMINASYGSSMCFSLEDEKELMNEARKYGMIHVKTKTQITFYFNGNVALDNLRK